MRYFVTFPSGEDVPVEVNQQQNGAVAAVVGGRTLEVDSVGADACTAMRVGADVFDVWMEDAPPAVGVVARGGRFYVRVESERSRAQSTTKGAAHGNGTVTSPMPGRVLKLLVAEGDAVTAGTALVVVEAMKMENEIAVARDGTVRRIHVTPGQTVDSGALLVEVE